jgi:protein-tyrosine-phosphatase
MTTSPSRTEMPGLLDPQTSMRRQIDDLAARFAGMVNRETVERMVLESYTALGRTAKIKTHLPLLACRFATERLTALAQAKGLLVTERPEVLFICVKNAGRSQIAAAYLEHLSEGRVHVRSAGSVPANEIDPTVTAALAEVGLSTGEAFPKPLTDDVVQAADVVITMGCGDSCPVYPGKRYLDWNVTDPADQPIEVVREVRDAIATRVESLLADLGE